MTWTIEQAQNLVNQCISEQLCVSVREILPDSHVMEDLGADSLDVVELVLALEEAFGIEVPDEDVEDLKTPRKLAEYFVSQQD